MRLFQVICAVVLFAVAWCSVAYSELPLDLIAVFHSDSLGGQLMRNAMSPGDIDGDGFSELFVRENGGERRIHVFSGGNPPDSIPDMLIKPTGPTQAWIPDINGDGVDDFATMEHWQVTKEAIDIYFGGLDFLSKTEPDLQLLNATDTFIYFGQSISGSDFNCDGMNDLVISTPQVDTVPYDGRFYIYYGGDILDTVVDEMIDFFDQGNGYDDFWRGTVAGDVNGDGYADMIYTGHDYGSPGYVAVIFGCVPLDPTPDHIMWSPFQGDPYSADHNFGQSLYPLGDINKDGYDDFAVGGNDLWPCIFFGGDPFDTIPLILGDTTDEYTKGDRIANIGDINDDGWDDIGVGFPEHNFGGGAVYIYFGYRTMDSEADLFFPDAQVFPATGGRFGYSVGPAGDFNGDGVDDVVITSRGDYNPDFGRGNVYVYAGDPTLPTSADESEDESQLPVGHDLLKQNYPNPFNSSTVIEYTLWGHAKREVEIAVYNILGQRIALLKDCTESGGSHFVTWDGTDDHGNSVPSGVYFYALKSDYQTLTRKMLFLK